MKKMMMIALMIMTTSTFAFESDSTECAKLVDSTVRETKSIKSDVDVKPATDVKTVTE